MTPAEGLVASEQPAVVAPALSSAGGRVVDLSAELGEPAGSWQVAETAPGSGSWAVLRDGARVGIVRRESTRRGRRGWLARLDTGVPLPAHGDLAAAAGSGLGAPVTWPPPRSPARPRHGAVRGERQSSGPELLGLPGQTLATLSVVDLTQRRAVQSRSGPSQPLGPVRAAVRTTARRLARSADVVDRVPPH